MTAPSGVAEIERFRTVVTRRLGLQFDDAKLGFLGEVLDRRIAVTGQIGQGYLRQLDESREELAAVARELTVSETYFFRHIDQFHAFREVALPESMRRRGNQHQLHLLSAGCASGEEPDTLAILLRQAELDPSWDVSILGLDVSRTALEKADGGRYTAWALRETPPDVQQRWFRRSGSEFILDESVRRGVTLTECNLMEDDPELWPANFYDVIFCRNVIMYFGRENAQPLVARITRSLTPGGFLFLGHAETLRGLSPDYHLHHTHGTFYYQRKDGAASPSSVVDVWPDPLTHEAPALAALVETNDSWVLAIQQAAERIQLLTQPSPADTVPTPAPSWDLGRALDLLRGERFVDALELIATLPAVSARDADVLLLHAVLLTHNGQLAEAEEVCGRLLAIDDLNAGAHYVLALCREGVGDLQGAAEHDQSAAYLDPTFAMPRLHLGLLARRRGDWEAMRGDLEHALTLLEREDASRLLLFGGGFTRDALAGLCRAELQANRNPR